MSSFYLSAKYLAALAQCVSKEATRFYLQGIYFTKATAVSVRKGLDVIFYDITKKFDLV